MTKQYLIGHRGAMGLAPENTLKSIRLGCECNTEAIEFDIHLSRDKEIVVIHDHLLNRTTNGQGWVRDFTLAELKTLDAGEGEKIPTLAEVMELIQSFGKRVIIEIKGESLDIALETTKKLYAFMKEDDKKTDLEVHSFWHPAIQQIKEADFSIQTAAIMMVGLAPRKTLELVQEANADGASVAWDYVSEELVELFHNQDLALNSYTLNDTVVFNRVKEFGVNGLITNFPDRFSV